MTAVYYESGGSAQEYHLRRFDNNFKYLFFSFKDFGYHFSLLLLLSFQVVELFCAGGLAEVHQSSREKLPTISRA